MLPFTLDSHFTYGYSAPFSDEGGELWCTYSRCTREPLSFDKECENVARLLVEEAQRLGRKPTIMLSGGLDSEIVVRAFMAIGADFDTITMRFGSLNQHELHFVSELVRKTGVRHSFFDLDIVKFINSDVAAEMFHGAKCVSVGATPHMHLMDHIWFNLGGLPILGNGDLYLENDGGSWQYVELESILSWFRHAVRKQILGGIGFFQHTPEVTLAAVRHPFFQRLARGEDMTANKILKDSRAVKYRMYADVYPGIRRRLKFHGYEILPWLIEPRNEQLGSYSNFDKKFKIPLVEFQRLLEPASRGVNNRCC